MDGVVAEAAPAEEAADPAQVVPLALPCAPPTEEGPAAAPITAWHQGLTFALQKKKGWYRTPHHKQRKSNCTEPN